MTGRYQAYPEYKKFKTVFLSSIPAHWDIKPLHTLCAFRQGKAHEPFVDVDGEYICVNSRFVSTGGQSVKYCTENLTPANRNDILMVMSDLPNGRALAKAFVVKDERKYAVNQRVCALTAQRIHAKFLYYQLDRSPYFLMYDDGSNQTHLSNDAYKKYPVLLPSLDEQTQIANFLDHETAKIDTLIDKQQQLIKLLKEKRQAVISHAVTKGLKPAAPMRDSGVEWLGEVPEHWEIRAVSKLSSKITNGYVGPTRDILVSDGVPYVQATHIKKGKVNFDGAYFVRKLWSESHAKSILVKGDVLIVQTGAGTGDIGLVSGKEEGFNCHALIIVQPNKNIISGDFLSLAFQSQYGYSVLYSIRTGGMHPHLNCGEVQYVKLPVPPRTEQDKITDYINQQIVKFDALVEKQLEAILLMQERRTALISSAVTGKIDVRNWQAPEQNQTNKEEAA